jgi:hypothetical protein
LQGEGFDSVYSREELIKATEPQSSQRKTKTKKIKEKGRKGRDGEKRIKKRIRTQMDTDEHR